ncbi:hypothetical protein BJ742DRAFT_828492 [Cladochytrium replicatum]|nr:hypothetical protein BJ742DRAFT_828492 [Cladochytrium replicatum]
MELINSLADSAIEAYREGDARKAFQGNFKAVNAVLLFLLDNVKWGHDQQISSKPDNISHLFRIAHLALNRAEEIVKNRGSTTVLASEQKKTYLSDAGHEEYEGLHGDAPLVPFSPFARQLFSHVNQLKVAQSRLAKVQAESKDSVSLTALRRLVEDVRIQRTKCDDISLKMEQIAAVPLAYWRPEEIAQEVTRIDVEIFSRISPRLDLPIHQSSPNVKACLDFHEFLERIVITSVLRAQPHEQGSQPLPPNAPHLARAHAIHHAVSIAFTFLYIYRNLNGLCAVLKALNSPEIQRLKKTWELVGYETTNMLRHLLQVAPVSFDMSTLAHEHKVLVSDLLQAHYRGGGLITIVPWLEPCVAEVDDIKHAYVVAGEAYSGSNEVVLSDIGTRLLEQIIAQVELCQGAGTSELTPAIFESSSGSTSGKGRKTTGAGGPPAWSHPVAPPSDDLRSIGIADNALQHYILTRVFFPRQFLWKESARLERLEKGEINPYPEEPQVRKLQQINQSILDNDEKSVTNFALLQPTQTTQSTEPLQEIGEANDAPDTSQSTESNQDDGDLKGFPSIPTESPLRSGGDVPATVDVTDEELERRIFMLTAQAERELLVDNEEIPNTGGTDNQEGESTNVEEFKPYDDLLSQVKSVLSDAAQVIGNLDASIEGAQKAAERGDSSDGDEEEDLLDEDGNRILPEEPTEENDPGNKLSASSATDTKHDEADGDQEISTEDLMRRLQMLRKR